MARATYARAVIYSPSRLVLLTVLAATLALPAAAQAKGPVSTLYVQQASGGRIEHVAGRWRLVLQSPSRQVTTFTDRPERVGGSVSLPSFVSGWRAAFGSVAPNAALEIAGAPSSRDVALLSLGTPRRDARKNTVTYSVKPLTRTTATRLQTLARRADRIRGEHIGHVSLFIDDGGDSTTLLWALNVSGSSVGTGFQLSLGDGFALTLDGGMYETSFQSQQGMAFTVDPSDINGAPIGSGSTDLAWSGSASGFLTAGSKTMAVTGVATLQAGVTVTLQIAGGPPTAISASGPFSIPVS